MILADDAKERVLNEVDYLLLTDNLRPISQSTDSEPQFAQPTEREKDVVDRFLEQATEQVQPFVNDWVQQIQTQIETIAAKDISDTAKYAELEQALEQVYPNLSVTEFAEVLGTAMLASQLAGRYEVLEEIRDA